MSSRLEGRVPLAVMRRVVRTAVRPVLCAALDIRHQRRLLALLGRPSAQPTNVHVSARKLGGRPALRVAPLRADGAQAVLFLHGGGYTVGGAATHLPMVAWLAEAMSTPVYLVDYRLAPEHPAPAALEDALAAYLDLLASGIASHRIAVAGDSAGGGLALALAVALRDSGRPLPGALGLVSPWVDLSLTNVRDDERDPMLTRAWLESCATAYAGTDRLSPDVSPLYAELSGLPSTVVQGASDEILLGDIERLVTRLSAADVPVEYQPLNGLWHVAHLHAGLVPESTAAVTLLGEALAQRLAHAEPTLARTLERTVPS